MCGCHVIMSLFFRPSSSESESDESEDAPVATHKTRRWIEMSSDEEEEEKRVVRSAKEKRWGAIQTIAKNIKNHTKIQDFVSMLADFEELAREINKAQSVVATEGLPAFYLRAIIRLEDAVAAITTEAKKKMNSNNNRSFTKLKTQLKKQNQGIEDKLEAFRQNPVDSEESEEEKPAKKAGKTQDEDDEDWEGEEEDDEDEVDDRVYDPENPRAFWTIKEARDKDEPKKDKPKKSLKPRPKVEVEVKEEEEEKVIYTPQLIESKLKEIADSRGKKAVNFKDIHDILVEMLQNAHIPSLRVEILLQLIPTIFDLSRNLPSIIMSRETWTSAVQKLREFLELFHSNSELFAGEFQHRFQALQVGLSHFNERLNEELKKAMRACEPHTTEYSDRLRDSHILNSLVKLSYDFFRDQKDGPNEARMALLLLEFSYFVHDSTRQAMKQRYSGTEVGLFFQVEDSEGEITRLAEVVQTHGDDRTKAQASLMLCYHHAVHCRHFQAKRIFELLPTPEGFASDPASQALYNRTLVRVGISGFCTGALQDAFTYLNDIVATRRLRELLAQVGSGSKDKSQVQDREERRRMMPFHMHISEDMVEAVYLISALILDLPKIAANPLEAGKVGGSKTLKKLLEIQEKQGYFGPPESSKDYITSACALLRTGDWEAAWSTLLAMDFWRLVPNCSGVQATILEKVKEAALIVHVLTYSEHYSSFSKSQLAQMFHLTAAQVFSALSGLIYSKLLGAYWEDDCLFLDSTSSSRLHYLAAQLASRTTQVLEINEKLMEYRGVASLLLSEQRIR